MADPAANNWPAPPAEPPVFGLTTSLPIIKSGRWQAGITYTPEGCINGTTLDLYTVGAKTPVDHPDEVTWIPYILSTYTQCSTFSGDEENIGRARRALLADSERQLATEFWEGNIAQAQTWQGAPSPNTWLADSTDTNFVDLGGPAYLSDALACLDDYLSNLSSGQQGVIHCTPRTLDRWFQLDNLRYDNGNYYTATGTLVISSPGYTGDSPDESYGTDNIWAYATDMPRIFMEDVRVPTSQLQNIDRANNTIAILAERVALAEWSRCRHAGIRLHLEACGG